MTIKELADKHETSDGLGAFLDDLLDLLLSDMKEGKDKDIGHITKANGTISKLIHELCDPEKNYARDEETVKRIRTTLEDAIGSMEKLLADLNAEEV